MKLGNLLTGHLDRGGPVAPVAAGGCCPGLPADVADWPDERRDAYEERCGIMEFDGLIPREEAERLAEAEARLDSRKEEGT